MLIQASLSNDTRVRARNQLHARAFEQNQLIALTSAPVGREVRVRLLASLRPWAAAFQRLVCSRAALEDKPLARTIAVDHLREEIGHDQLLATDGAGEIEPRWDAIIAACSSWFVDEVHTGDSVARAVLVHLVLEESSRILHHLASPTLADSAYFAAHAGADDKHVELGYQLLEGLPPVDDERVAELLERGWQVIGLLCTRLAELARGADASAACTTALVDGARRSADAGHEGPAHQRLSM